MATISSSYWDELESLLLDEDIAVPVGAPVLRNQESSTLFVAPQDEDLLCLDRTLAHHMVNFTGNLFRMLGQTRDALYRGHTLRTVMLAVMKQEAHYLQTDQPDVAAAVAAAVHFYSRLTTPMIQKLVSRCASASTTAPPLASHITTATPTNKSSTPPPPTGGPIASEGCLALFPPTPVAALYTEEAPHVRTANPTYELLTPVTVHEPIDFGGPFVPSPPVPIAAAHTAAAAAATGVDGQQVGTSAGPAEVASAATYPSLSVGVEAAATLPAAAGASSSSSFLSEQRGRESNDTLMETATPGLSRVSDGETRATRLRKTCDVCCSKKLVCKSSEVGAACGRCKQRGIRCVFSPARKTGPKQGGIRRRGKAKTEPPFDVTAPAAAAAATAAATTAAPATAATATAAPATAAAATAAPATAVPATAASATAAAAAAAPALQLRDNSGPTSSMRGLKRPSPDTVNVHYDLPAGGECSFTDDEEEM